MKIIKRLLWRSPPPPPIPPEWLAFELAALRSQLDFQMKCLKILDKRMMIVQNAIEDLKAEVGRISGIKDSMDAAFAGLKKQLADALANSGDPAAVLAVVKDLHDGLDGLAASVVANP